MNDNDARIERLISAIYKLSSWAGCDISELVEQGYLEEGDLD